jgi:hypothetical protein
MGLYSVFLGVGQVIGAIVGGIAASWKGIDGLVVATGLLLIVGIMALINLRAHEGRLVDGSNHTGTPGSMHDSIRDTLAATGGRQPRPSEAALEEKS